MMRYPARYQKESDTMYFIEFIDFPHAITQGKNLDELRSRSQDVLSMAIKHNLNRDIAIPEPSQVEGDDVIWVEPYPEIRQRMGHKKGCGCPVCRNARGERKRTKKNIFLRLNEELAHLIEKEAKEKGVKRIVVIETALKQYFNKAS
ncbi:MAG: hypothetical protein RDV48_23995 [Candidatus Eremiobacteraeota bacterium]|nr:hypothetical protein [Candidatus Eremiobacteraeota bacterium]